MRGFNRSHNSEFSQPSCYESAAAEAALTVSSTLSPHAAADAALSFAR